MVQFTQLLILNSLMVMTFTLPELKYGKDALAPVISNQTIEFHHGKHHQTYVTNLNKLIVGTPFENETLETIVKQSDGAIFNNAAQVWNHTFYFEQFASRPAPIEGTLAGLIKGKWGSIDEFKKEFNAAGVAVFGSGWVWLVVDVTGDLKIVKSSNADTPLKQGMTPLMTFDVWEHAYYLDYQNRRADYLAALWQILDWKVIEKRYVAL